MTLSQNVAVEQPVFKNRANCFGGKHVKKVFVACDPLTNVPYFDAVDLAPHFEVGIRHQQRAMKNREHAWVELKIHADMIKAKTIHAIAGLSPAVSGGGIRGTVRGFSKASRKRMIEFMAKTRVRGQLLFATFTYPDLFPVGDVDVWNSHFEALRRRIERHYPSWSIIWREELQPRKSGENKDKVAPHFHFLIDTGVSGEPSITVEKYFKSGYMHDKTTSPVSRSFEAWSLQAWFEIVGSGDDKHAEHGSFVVACRNKKHAYKYIAKYVAKEEQDEFEVGRRWGRIGKWDTTESDTVILTRQEYTHLMRAVASWLKAKAGDNPKNIGFARMYKGFSPFNGSSVFGIGDSADTGDFFKKLLNYVADLSGTIRPFGDWYNLDPDSCNN